MELIFQIGKVLPPMSTKVEDTWISSPTLLLEYLAGMASAPDVTRGKGINFYLQPVQVAAEKFWIPKTDGSETITKANDIFVRGVSGNCSRWAANVPGKPTVKTQAQIFEVTDKLDCFEDLSNIPGCDLDSLCWEQSQIVAFCRKYQHWFQIRKGYSTIFPFKVEKGNKKELFAADIDLYSGDECDVDVLCNSFRNCISGLYPPWVVLPCRLDK